MNEIDFERTNIGAFYSSLRPAYARRGAVPVLQSTQDSEYREMEDAFRATGGIAVSEAITTLLSRTTNQPISMLARWIVDHNVLGFEWRARTLLPMFQFDLATMYPNPAVGDVLRELVPVLSEWGASLWFARSNSWIRDAAPVDVIAREPHAVFQAARADRFLASA